MLGLFVPCFCGGWGVEVTSAGSEFCFIRVSLTPDLNRCLDCQVCPPSRTRILKKRILSILFFFLRSQAPFMG